MKLPKELSIAEIATITGGRIEGPPQTMVTSVATLPSNAKPGQLALIFDIKQKKHLESCQASALVVAEGIESDIPKVVVKRPLLALQRMLTAVAPRRFLPGIGIHPSAVVDPSAQLGNGVCIGPLVVIGANTKIGDNTKIMAGSVIGGMVTIGNDCLFHSGTLVADYVQIGNRVILQQGASIGADGFGYVTEKTSNLERRIMGAKDLSDEDNPHLKIPQIGVVIIEDDVEIGSNTTVDRATMGATVIGRGTKIDNLVMIAHNCQIGRESIIVSLTGMAGSVSVGDRAVIAGHVGIKDHIKIGKDAIVEGKAGVMKDVGDGEIVVGSPALPVREFFTNVAMAKRAPQIYSELKELKKKVAQLEMIMSQKELAKSN